MPRIPDAELTSRSRHLQAARSPPQRPPRFRLGGFFILFRLRGFLAFESVGQGLGVGEFFVSSPALQESVAPPERAVAAVPRFSVVAGNRFTARILIRALFGNERIFEARDFAFRGIFRPRLAPIGWTGRIFRKIVERCKVWRWGGNRRGFFGGDDCFD